MKLLLRLLLAIDNVVYFILFPIMSFINRKKPPRIPPTTDVLLTLSAAKLAKMIRLGETTSYDVVNAYVERIKEVNPFINAVVDKRFEDAIIEAKVYDERLKNCKVDPETLEKESPLYGVPFTVKESCGVKGLCFTGGTLGRKDMKADADGDLVKQLRDVGAIPLCVTNTPEMCCDLDSANRLFGRTCNPYDTRYSAGGSSGGEGAIIGAGASLIGIASDLGGSIRIPALFNGVFGYKPSPRLMSIKGHLSMCEDEVFFEERSVVAPMTRYADDLILVTKILTSKCDRNLDLDTPVDMNQLKVYYRQNMDKTFGILSTTSDMEQCVVEAAEYFMERDIHTQKLPIEWPTELFEISLTQYMKLEKPLHVLLDVHDPKKYDNPVIELAKFWVGLSHHTMSTIIFALLAETRIPFSRSDILSYAQQAKPIRQNLMNLLADNGILLFPTFRTPTYLPVFSKHELINMTYCAIFNNFGFPSVHVPMGLNHKGLPVGVQVIAAPYQDRLCLAVAKELEKAFGGWVSPSTSVRD